MNMVNSLAPDLMRDFNIRGDQLGFLGGAYFDANLIFLFPAGMILDRFSTKKVVLITLGICTLGTFLFSQATSFEWAIVFRFLTGIGSAFCFLSCMRLASTWFHDSRLALITGLIMTLAFLGGTVAQAPMTNLISSFGWRHAVLLDGSLGVLIFLIILVSIKDYPDHQTEIRAKNKQALESLGFWKSLRMSYLNWQNWLGGICTNMMNLPIYILGAIWGGVFLVQIEGFSRLQASEITGMIFIGTLIGSPLVGWLSDRVGRRKPLIVLGALISLGIVSLIIYGPHFSYLALMALFFLLGLISASQIINYPLVAEKNPQILTATSVSVVSFNVIAGGAVFQPVVGWLLDKNWSGTLVDGVRIYSASAYHHAFIVLPIGFILALIMLIFIKDSHGKQMA
jgi:MFS family permease